MLALISINIYIYYYYYCYYYCIIIICRYMKMYMYFLTVTNDITHAMPSKIICFSIRGVFRFRGMVGGNCFLQKQRWLLKVPHHSSSVLTLIFLSPYHYRSFTLLSFLSLSILVPILTYSYFYISLFILILIIPILSLSSSILLYHTMTFTHENDPDTEIDPESLLESQPESHTILRPRLEQNPSISNQFWAPRLCRPEPSTWSPKP